MSGADARFRPIACGASYKDRGMRPDSHDAVGVVITTASSRSAPFEFALVQDLMIERATTVGGLRNGLNTAKMDMRDMLRP